MMVEDLDIIYSPLFLSFSGFSGGGSDDGGRFGYNL